MTRPPDSQCQCAVSPHCRVCRQLLVPLLHMINRASGQWSQLSTATSLQLPAISSRNSAAAGHRQLLIVATTGRARNKPSRRFHNQKRLLLHSHLRIYCEAQARVRQGSARDGSQGKRTQSLNPSLELTLKLVATHPPASLNILD